MKYGILIFLCLAFSMPIVSAQEDIEKTKRAAEVRTVIEKTVAEGHLKVKGVTFDVRIFEGRIIKAHQEDFVITSRKGKNSVSKILKIRYRDVIELETKSAFVSFFPDPDQKPFADWAAVRELRHGDSLDIDLVSREQLFGVLLKVSDSDLTILQGNKSLIVKRADVARILLARRDTPEAKKIFKGAGKGAASAPRGGGGSNPGAAIVQAVVIAGATAAGAVKAASKRWPNDRLLIYAR